MSGRALLLPLVSLLLAGCALPPATEAPAVEPFADGACGFRLDAPARWNRGGAEGSGLLLLESLPSAGRNETLLVAVGPASLREAAREAAASGAFVPAPGVLLQEGRVTEHGEDALGGEPAFRMRVEGDHGGSGMAWELRFVEHGNRTLLAGWGVEADREPSPALRRAVDSLRLTGAPTDACGGEDGPKGSAPVDADGWTGYAHPDGLWTWRHPANWSVRALGRGAEAMLFASPPEGPSDPYEESVFVAVRPGVPEGATLDGMVEETLDMLRTRKPGFELVGVENATLGGGPARLVVTNETSGTEVEARRLLAVRGDVLYWVEAVREPGAGEAFLADLERALATFRFGT